MYSLVQRFFAILLFCMLLPLFAVLAIIIKIDSKGPVFFRQRRIGKNNSEFLIYKFRSMRTDTPDVATHLLSDPSIYITGPGKFLRKTSLDELPQLINIIMGDMLFVGPRPALYNQDDLITLRTEKGVDKLMPGLTGWAQVNGRDELPIPVKVAFDEEYLKKRSVLFDIRICFLTIKRVVTGDGVREGGSK